MGATTLVSRDQIQGGEDLLRALPHHGVVVTGAAWAKAEGDGQPYLYIVSPTVETDGPLEAAGRLVTTLRGLDVTWTDPFRRLDPFAIKLIGSSEPLAQGIVDHNRRFPAAHHTWHGGDSLGPVPIEGAYIYPAKMFAAPPARPQSP